MIRSVELNNVTMGNPFTMGKESVSDIDVYYFPIFESEQFLYTFRVFKEDGQYTGILSPYMVEHLNQYIGETSQDKPLYIYMQSGNVIAENAGEIAVWEERHFGYEGNEKQLVTLSEDVILESTNIYTPIKYKKRQFHERHLLNF